MRRTSCVDLSLHLRDVLDVPPLPRHRNNNSKSPAEKDALGHSLNSSRFRGMTAKILCYASSTWTTRHRLRGGVLKGARCTCPYAAAELLALPLGLGHFRDRNWPNRIWPELVFQSLDRIWPNRIWPELVFLVCFGHVRVCVQNFGCVEDCVCFKILGVFKIVCVCCVCVVCAVCVVCVVCAVCCVCCVFKIFGGCLQDFWWVSSRFLVGVFKIVGGCLQDFWWVSSRFLVGVFKIFGASPLDPQTPLRRSAPSAGAPPPQDRNVRVWSSRAVV